MRTSRQAARTSGAVGLSARTTVVGLPGPWAYRAEQVEHRVDRCGRRDVHQRNLVGVPDGEHPQRAAPGHEPGDQIVGPQPDVDRPGRVGQEPHPGGNLRSGGPQLRRHLRDEGLPRRGREPVPWWFELPRGLAEPEDIPARLERRGGEDRRA